jgi:hypothetical protein
MNGEQFKYLIYKKYNINSLYWAPEAATYNLKNKYNISIDNYLTALLVLTDYEQSFKNRIEGIIVDDWLSFENFESILKECIDILTELSDPKFIYKLSNWQLELLDYFKRLQNS